jgi:hypothetical protein
VIAFPNGFEGRPVAATLLHTNNRRKIRSPGTVQPIPWPSIFSTTSIAACLDKRIKWPPTLIADSEIRDAAAKKHHINGDILWCNSEHFRQMILRALCQKMRCRLRTLDARPGLAFPVDDPNSR